MVHPGSSSLCLHQEAAHKLLHAWANGFLEFSEQLVEVYFFCAETPGESRGELARLVGCFGPRILGQERLVGGKTAVQLILEPVRLLPVPVEAAEIGLASVIVRVSCDAGKTATAPSCSLERRAPTSRWT